MTLTVPMAQKLARSALVRPARETTGTRKEGTMTTAVETTTEAEISQVNDALIDAVIKTDNSGALNRGLSMVTRNRILVALAQPQGLAYLSYGEGDGTENVRAAIRAAGEWLLRVADEAV